MGKNGFTLVEILVVVLIIGILAAIALPQYQSAVDKAKYTKIMPITKSILEAQMRALMVKENPTFKDLDIEMPASCTVNEEHPWAVSCDNEAWGCLIKKNSSSPVRYWIRCTDTKLNASYFYTIIMDSLKVDRRCYAHTLEEDDRANRLCKAVTGKTNHEVTEDIAMFHHPNGPWVQSHGYVF